MSPRYQLEINQNNKIGNGKIGISMPFKNNFGLENQSTSSISFADGKLMSANNRVSLAAPDCTETTKGDFMACMDCLLIEKCGSSWGCAALCGLDVIICVGAAGIGCITASSP